MLMSQLRFTILAICVIYGAAAAETKPEDKTSQTEPADKTNQDEKLDPRDSKLCDENEFPEGKLKEMGMEAPDFCSESKFPFPTLENVPLLFPLYVICLVYLFCFTAKGADEFMMPNLEIIVHRFGIPEDFAGATLMAFAGSVPEFTLSVMAASKGDDSGIGAIIGSTMYNLLAIEGACVVANSSGVSVTGWNITRDSIMQIITIGVLFLAAQFPLFGSTEKTGEPKKEGEHVGTIAWGECLLLLSVYIAYVVFITFNRRVAGLFGIRLGADNNKAARSSIGRSLIVEKNKTVLDVEVGPTEDDDEPQWGMVGCVCWNITLPIHYFYWAVNFDFAVDHPQDVDKTPIGKALYSFFISVLAVAFGCVIISDIGGRIAQYLKISSYLWGMTVLAIGTSIPDTFASMWAAERNFGDMAICSGYGSNNF